MRKYFIILGLILIGVAWFLFARFSSITIRQLDELGAVKIKVDFRIPIKQTEDIGDKIQFFSERPNTEIAKSFRWVDSKTLEIFAMEKELPKGFKTKFHIGPLKTYVPGLYKVVKADFQVSIPPFLTGISPIVSSSGPIIMDFSTPIDMEQLKKGLMVDFEYTLRQGHIVSKEGKIFWDNSSIEVLPEHKLIPGKKYEIQFKGLLSNLKGNHEKVGFHRIFQVAKPPNVIETNPTNGEKDVKLYEHIIVNFDEDIKEANIKVSNMNGDVKTEGKTAVFKPHSVFMPNETYKVEVTGKSIFNEKIRPHIFEFHTLNMKDKWWVEINLRSIQKVTVYKGGKIIRSMVASAGLSDPEYRTPRGFFSLKDRGKFFWAEKIQEGGLYWVRITGNYLIHSIPRNKDNEIIEEELKKLGIPASHGCVRLKDHYAKWFYETVPAGTMVIIHD